jgi:hypothetical protein
MRAFCATAALCLAVLFVPSAEALAHARHHRGHPVAVPLPPERPDISSMFTIIQRGRPNGPDGLAAKPAR